MGGQGVSKLSVWVLSRGVHAGHVVCQMLTLRFITAAKAQLGSSSETVHGS